MPTRGSRPTVAFATCRAYPNGSPDDRLAIEALEARAVPVAPAVWDAPTVAWSEFDLVILRSTWDYFERPAEFDAWLDRVGRSTTLWNPTDLVRWNAHKSYLLDLEARGVPIVPTELLRRGATVDFEALLNARGWSSVVLKPAIGGNAYRLSRGSLRDAPGGRDALSKLLRNGDALVQPFLPRAHELGERSLVFFDGSFSHAVGHAAVLEESPRRPRSFVPSPEEMEAAHRVLEGLRPTPLYARLDLLPDDTGAWRLGELEVIEPELFFGASPPSAHRFADAVERRLAA